MSERLKRLQPILADDDARALYRDLTAMVERMHRRHLEVVRLGLEGIGVNDINAAQALLLMTIGDNEVPVRDLIQRGYYLASSASYNIKKLVDYGYLEQLRSPHDRRAVRLRLSPAGAQVVLRLRELDEQLTDLVADEPGLVDAMAETLRTLKRLERVWSDFVTFG